MKALILAGGRGKRLGNITESVNKCMLILDRKPVLEYNIERAADIEEIDEILIVAGHRAEDIINRFGTAYKDKRIRYVIQWEQKGLVHAIECARDALGKDDFFLLLGDEVIGNSRHVEMLKAFLGENLFAVCGVLFQKDVSKIGKTYTVLTDNDGRIFRLIEKPKKALNNWQGTGTVSLRTRSCITLNEHQSILKGVKKSYLIWFNVQLTMVSS